MTFLSILAALLIEQIRPLRADNLVYAGIKQLAVRMEIWFNDGDARHGRMAWIAMMLILIVPVMLVYWLCVVKLGVFAVFALNVLIVYLTLGFRHYSHHFTSIQLALNSGDDITARRLLAEWTGKETAALSNSEVARITVEQALITTHRNVFGVFFWFLLPLGPAGAILYRLAEYLSRTWNEPDRFRSDAFGRFAERAFYWIEWIPARLTAIAFAVVGNFEDAVYAWRNNASRWQDEAIGIILSAGGGAMGLRLGAEPERAGLSALPDSTALEAGSEAEPQIGEEAGNRALQSTVGLVWRALLLWMLLLLLLSFAVWFG